MKITRYVIVSLLFLLVLYFGLAIHLQNQIINKFEKQLSLRELNDGLSHLEENLKKLEELNVKLSNLQRITDSVYYYKNSIQINQTNISNKISEQSDLIIEFINKYRYSQAVFKGTYWAYSYIPSEPLVANYSQSSIKYSLELKGKLIWILKKRKTTALCLQIVLPSIRSYWEKLSKVDKIKIKDALSLSEKYLIDKAYLGDVKYYENLKNKQGFRPRKRGSGSYPDYSDKSNLNYSERFESFIFRRIYFDGVEPENLLSIIKELKKL